MGRLAGLGLLLLLAQAGGTGSAASATLEGAVPLVPSTADA